MLYMLWYCWNSSRRCSSLLFARCIFPSWGFYSLFTVNFVVVWLAFCLSHRVRLAGRAEEIQTRSSKANAEWAGFFGALSALPTALSVSASLSFPPSSQYYLLNMYSSCHRSFHFVLQTTTTTTKATYPYSFTASCHPPQQKQQQQQLVLQ